MTRFHSFLSLVFSISSSSYFSGFLLYDRVSVIFLTNSILIIRIKIVVKVYDRDMCLKTMSCSISHFLIFIISMENCLAENELCTVNSEK